MKKFTLLLLSACFFLLIIIPFSSAFLFDPNTVQEMNLNVSLKGHGSFYGNVGASNEIQVKVLTLSSTENQKVQSITEKLYIGNDVIAPTYETINGNRYAVFSIKNLASHANTPSFNYEIKANVITSSAIVLGKDYDLSRAITEQSGFLAPSKYIESDDSAIKSKVALDFQSNSFLESVRSITDWVHSNVVYDFNYYPLVLSAKKVYEVRGGVCDEFANLTAAFFRAKGIPARYNVGVSFDGDRWGNHGWLEVFLPGTGWIGVDSTYGEAGFLDATHLTLAKVVDISDATDSVVYPEGISVELIKDEPSIEINSKNNFSGFLELKLDFPLQVDLSEPFKIKLNAKNLNSFPLIAPLSLRMHSDFSVDRPERLELFEAGEEKAIEWNALSPGQGEKGKNFIYSFALQSIDQSLEEKITVTDKTFSGEQQSNISILNVNPFISGNEMKLEIELKNTGSKEGTVLIDLNYNGKEEHYSETVPAIQEKKLSYTVKNAVPETSVYLVITANDVENPYSIKIPEETAKPPASNAGKELQSLEEIFSSKYFIAGVLGTILIFVIIIGFFLRGTRK
ncbi:MAG: transglutaminase family protein [Candidatus Diapherotrites archaeon]